MPPMDNVTRLSGVRLAALIREGTVSSADVVEAHIAEIERLNPALNAVVADRFEQARDEAKAADEALARPTGDPPPFLGVPCTIKECFALEQMPNTSGLVSRKGIVPERDATVVARVRAAGAIPLGVTNVSELCMWMESFNRVYGRTHNPYDLRRTVGGSSGGEGAIIGAGASPFGLGSDIGGSIRMPAFFNGVFGHKPTGGLVPATGQFPIAENEALRYLCTGPLARRAEDLMPLLRVLAGPDGQDQGCRELVLGNPDAVDLTSLRVVDVEDDGRTSVSPALRKAQRAAVTALESRGASVVRARPAALRSTLDIWSSMVHVAGGTSFGALLGTHGTSDTLREFARWGVRRSPHTLPALALTLLEKIPALTPQRTERFTELGRDLKTELEALIGEHGVMLYPSFAASAPHHFMPLVSPQGCVYPAIFNVMELPVTQVPLGLDERGLPLGVQVASLPGNDHITIAVACALEEIFGGWVPPPLARQAC